MRRPSPFWPRFSPDINRNVGDACRRLEQSGGNHQLLSCPVGAQRPTPRTRTSPRKPTRAAEGWAIGLSYRSVQGSIEHGVSLARTIRSQPTSARRRGGCSGPVVSIFEREVRPNGRHTGSPYQSRDRDLVAEWSRTAGPVMQASGPVIQSTLRLLDVSSCLWVSRFRRR